MTTIIKWDDRCHRVVCPIKCMDRNELEKTICTLEKHTENLSFSDQENQVKETSVLNTFVKYMLYFGSRLGFLVFKNN